jgi:hypothetical protein
MQRAICNCRCQSVNKKGAVAIKSGSAPSTYLIFEDLFIESAAQNHAVDLFKV